MKFQINKKILSSILIQASKTIPTRSTLPILSCALFEVVENDLIIKTTNLEIYYLKRTQVNNAEQGKIAIPIHKLIEITTAIDDELLNVSVSDIGKIELETEAGKYTIMGQQADEFPSDPVINDAQTITLKSEQIINIIKATTYATSKDDMKPVLQGVYLLFEGEKITAVATDGHKLVKFETSTPTSYSGVLIVPVKFLNTIKDIVSGNVEVYIGENHIQTTNETTTISSRIIKEKYPNYEKVIPQDNPNTLVVDKNELIESVKRISIFSNKTTKQIALSINEDHAIITTEDAESVTSGTEKITCDYSGQAITIGYNAIYLLEVLKQQQTNPIKILLKNPLSAAVFLDIGEENKKTTLLMPIRLND